MTATRRGRGAAASTSASSSSSSSFTPLTDLVPASIPYTDQARATLEALRRGQDPGLQALLRALNCARACEAAGAPYASRCLCRSFASASASSSSSASASVAPRGAGGGAAPRCVRGLAPPPGSYRKVGLWAKPPKSDEKAEEEEAKEEEGKEGEERPVPAGLFNLGATCYVAGALQCLFADPAFRQGLYNSTSGGGGRSDEGGIGNGGGDALQQMPADAAGAPNAAGGESGSGDAAVRALRRLFASMQAGTSASADPTPLVRALGLDAGEQQDGQEFFKLLLALLEERLQGSDGSGGGGNGGGGGDGDGAGSSSSASRLVPSLFQGRSSNETVCGLCSGRTSSSDRVEEFTELALPVRGSETLEQALAAAAAPEFLPGGDTGEAYIHCDRCGNPRAPATRRAVLLDLPPRLCVSLQRFVFDLRAMARAKVGDRMSFPLRLSAAEVRGGRAGEVSGSGGGSGGEGKGKGKGKAKKSAVVAAAGGEEKEKPEKGKEKDDDSGGNGHGNDDDDAVYELAAILIHKGTSAHHGHYVAHVALPRAGEGNEQRWWRFDDEGVSPLDGGPAGKAGSADHGVAAAPSAAAAKKAKAATAAAAGKRKISQVAAAAVRKKGGGGRGGRGGGARKKRNEPIVVGGSSDDDANADAEEESPTLVLSPLPSSSPAPSASASPRITSTNAYMLLYRLVGTEGPTDQEIPLPEDLRAWLREEEASAKAKEVAEAEAAAAARVVAEHRRAAVRRCLEAAPVPDDPIPEDARWVPARWFAEWCGANVAAEKKKEKKKGDKEEDSAAANVAAVAAALEEEKHDGDGDGDGGGDGDHDEDQDPDALPPFPPCDIGGRAQGGGVLCARHGLVDPLRLGKMKLLSSQAWEQARSDVGACVNSPSSSSNSNSTSVVSLPPLADSLCRDCTREALELCAAAAARSLEAAAAVDAVKQAGGVDRCPAPGDRWVSRHWYAAWLRRREQSAASSAVAAAAAKLKSPTAASTKADLLDAAGPTAAITCRHGRLLPAARCSGPARRSAVPEAVFDLVLSDYDERWGAFRRKKEGGGEKQEKKEKTKKKKRKITVDCGDDGVVEVSDEQIISSGSDDSDSDDENTNPSRVAASAKVFCFLLNPNSDGGCEECASAAAGGAAAAAEAKSRAERERAAAPSLAPPPGSSSANAPMPSSRLRFGESGEEKGEETMALLPREWLRRWRSFVSLATKRGSSARGEKGGGGGTSSSSLPPPSLTEAIRELCCSCHPCAPHGPRLSAPPPRLEQKRGKWGVVPASSSSSSSAAAAAAASAVAASAAAADPSSLAAAADLASSPLLPFSSTWEVVPAEAAACLASLYGSPDLPTVRFRVVNATASNGFPAAAELVPSPPVCAEAVAARAAAALDASLCYSEGTLQLEVCKPEDVVVVAAASGSGGEGSGGGGGGARTVALAAAAAIKLAAVGQRARRGRAAIEASAADTVWRVKLRAFEHLSVHPKNADVYALRRRKRKERKSIGNKENEKGIVSPEEKAASAEKKPENGTENGNDSDSDLPPALVATAAFAAASNPEFAWTLLDNDAATLRELRVPDGALLRIVDAGRVDGSDLSFVGGDDCDGNGGAALVGGNGKKGRRAPERGFAGTALFGGRGGGGGGVGEANKKQKKEEAEVGAEGAKKEEHEETEAEKMEVEVEGEKK